MQAVDLKFKNVENLHFGLKYLAELDATFILEALKMFPFSVFHANLLKIILCLIFVLSSQV